MDAGSQLPQPAPNDEADEVLEACGVALPGGNGRRQLSKLRYSHEAMIDLIITNPAIRQGELAARFGRTQSWISIVMATDAFKARLAQRRQELVDPEILASIEERFEAIVTRSQEVLLEKLAQPTANVSDQLALRAAELGAKVLGKGAFGQPVPPALPAGHLDSLADRLLALQSKIRQSAGGVVDVEVREVAPDGAELAQTGR